MFFHFFLFFLLVLLFFSGAQNPSFASNASRFPIKAFFSEKIFIFVPSREVPHWALFLFSRLFFICFHFFQFISMFFLFHSLFLYFPVVFLLKMFLPFSFCFFFVLFSGAQNLWRHSRILWGKVHILSWLCLLCIGSSSLFLVAQCTFW